MSKAYTLLLINDTSTRQMKWMAKEGTVDSYTINVDFSGANKSSAYYPGIAYLAGRMSSLVEQGVTFRNCEFITHGSPGNIKFGTDELTAFEWYSQFYDRAFYRLFPYPGARVDFVGCKVASGSSGWQFLEAAARSLVRGAGGWAIGWTSDGWKIPFFDPSHLSGNIRQVYVSTGGGNVQFYEGGNLITDGQGFPVRPY